MDRQRTLQLKLNNLDAEQLKALISEFKKDVKNVDDLSKNDLKQIISNEAQLNKKLQLRVNSLKVSFKPSFYILAYHSKIEEKYLKNLERNLKSGIDKSNSMLMVQPGTPVYKGFEFVSSSIVENRIIEFDLVWQKLHWYWSPVSFTQDNIYELNYGIIIIDLESKKAVISCHTIEEQDIIKVLIKNVFKIILNTLTMTKPLLDKVGSYDKVKRARYFISNDASNKIPANITYADESLSSKQSALDLESNPSSERKESFYRIPLGDIEEQGVGVTSDSGKLWIPKYFPIEVVKDYAKELLIRITDTLDGLAKDGFIETVYESLGVEKIEEIQTIKHIELRNEICRLIYELLLMLYNKDYERPFTINESLINSNSIPNLFYYPRLEIYDELTESYSFYNDENTGSQLIKIISKNGETDLFSMPGGESINLNSIIHPISGNNIKVQNFYSKLELIPTAKLQNIVNNTFKYVSSQFDRLKDHCHIPFRIKNNKLIIEKENINNDLEGYKRAEIFCADIIQFKKVIKNKYVNECEDYYRKAIKALGEKCKYCKDEECRACVRMKNHICLRSLVGEYLIDPFILNHKSIELSDIQGKLEYMAKTITIFGFAKQVKAKNNSLTARNPIGAVLFSQIFQQMTKPEFDTVLVITPNIVNEDLLSNLRLLCNVFKKKLLVFDCEILKILLYDFENRIVFKKLDITTIYKNSNKELAKLT